MIHQSLIFDLDGTLWDSTDACADGWNRALKKLGQAGPAMTAEKIGGIMGMPHEKIFAQLFPGEEPEQRERIGEACYREELASIQSQGAPLYPGVAEGLVKLAKVYPLYIVSNCLTDYLQVFFAWSNLAPLFRGALCHGDTGRGKAENLAELMKKHGLTDAAYIGDTGGDENAARRAGATYYHVDYGFGVPFGECVHFASFSELTEFFLSK